MRPSHEVGADCKRAACGPGPTRALAHGCGGVPPFVRRSETRSQVSDPRDIPATGSAKRWMIGCLVGLLALVGALVLVFLVAFVLSPPSWVQVLIGVLLVAGAALLSWVVAESLRKG